MNYTEKFGKWRLVHQGINVVAKRFLRKNDAHCRTFKRLL